MDLRQFVQDAVRTESQIEQVETNAYHLSAILNILVNAGNMLDDVKKNVFYGKPIDPEQTAKYIEKIETWVKSPALAEDPTEDTEVLNVDPRLFHAIIGTATESAELLEALTFNGDLDIVNILEEIGDLGWYAAIAMDATNTSMEAVLTAVIDKLKNRYPDKFTSDAAINRDLDTERDTLEKHL